jgi:hypothetical protein
MGLAFIDMPAEQQQVLSGWLRAVIPIMRRNVGEERARAEAVDPAGRKLR